MMVMCCRANAVVVSICCCTYHMSESGKYCYIFSRKGELFDPDGNYKDVFFFDWTSNVQKVGQIMCKTFPWAYCFDVSKNFVSLLQLSIKVEANQGKNQLFTEKSCHLSWSQDCRLCDVFGLGANHNINVQFMTHLSATAYVKRIGLLWGAGTRFVTWFYALHCLLHQTKVLLATIHSPYIAPLACNVDTALAVQDIKSNQFLSSAKSPISWVEDITTVMQTTQQWIYVIRLWILCHSKGLFHIM